MAHPPDPDALARRYATLWQEQMLAVAADPAVADAFARWISLFAMPAMPGFPGHVAAAPSGVPREHAPTAAAAGPAPAAGPPGTGDGDLEQLARRVAALEERIAGLESALRGADRRPRRAAPRRRP